MHNFGGGEKYVSILAEALSTKADVTLISTSQEVTKNKLEQYFNVDLSKVLFRYAKNNHDVSEFTKNYYTFICLSNFTSVKSYAEKKVQLLQIPYNRINIKSIFSKAVKLKIRESVKDCYRLILLSSTKKADRVITNSRFVYDFLNSNFNIKSQILYPPIDDFLENQSIKKNIIISVGRIFSGLYNDKRYDIMIQSFRELCKNTQHDWEYHIFGSLLNDDKSIKYFNSLQQMSEGLPVYFHPNEPYYKLKEWYNKATLFWHAAGFGVDEQKAPEKVEHFGMTTVEAMSAKCIPVVINRGGQKEIIAHGINGFLWDTKDELVNITCQIFNKQININDIQQNARVRYRQFSRDAFFNRVHELFENLLN